MRSSFHDNSSLTIRAVRGILDEWERGKQGDGSDSFKPDVIVIDYADILAPEDSRKDFRQQQNETWMAMRALSQNRNCCVITATQAAATSYDKRSVTLKDFSEDKRKYAHITACYTLQQTPIEKDFSVLRVGQLMAREGKGYVGKEVSVLQCIELGMPYVDSKWVWEVVVEGLKSNPE